MQLVLRRNCCKLETAVYAIGIILTTTYLVVGLGGVIWFVLCHMEDSEVMTKLKELYLLKMETMMDSLAVMGAVLVVTFMGLLTCLLLILGVRTEQRLLLLPWQLYHLGVILACFGGGLYQVLHFTVLTDGKDAFQACFALFPIVAGLFVIFIWVLVHQLAIRLRYRLHMERVIEEKRASLASIHLSLPRPPQTPDTRADSSHRSVRSIRTLKRRGAAGGGAGGGGGGGARYRSHSVEQILTEAEANITESPYYWVAGRSRSLPRHLDTTGYSREVQDRSGWEREEREEDLSNIFTFRDYNFDSVSLKQRQCRTLERSSRPRNLQIESEVITIPKCSTEKMRRKFAESLSQEAERSERSERCNTDTISRRKVISPSSQPNLSQSLVSVKNVTIHPEVTQFSYNHHKPRSVSLLAPLSSPKYLYLCFSSKVWRELNSTTSRLLLPSQSEKPSSPNSPSSPEQRDVNFLALSDTDTVDCYTVPSPVYPSSTLPLPAQNKRRQIEQMTRHQIIDLYCSSDRER